MDEAAIRALIASAVAVEVGKIVIPQAPDLSAYALKSDIPAAAPPIDMSAYALKSEVPALVRGTDSEAKEYTRTRLWLSRVLSKWFADERPSDADLSAPTVEEVNGRG
jgi:hypothetical protein